MAEEESYECADSGASATTPKQCSALRRSDHVMIKGRPCKIVEMSTSKTGKHGHAKVHLVAIDIFTHKKLEDICPSTHNMECPTVVRKDYTVLYEEDGHLVYLDDDNIMQADLKCPPKDSEIYKELKDWLDKVNNSEAESFKVTVLKAMGEECVAAVKQDREGK